MLIIGIPIITLINTLAHFNSTLTLINFSWNFGISLFFTSGFWFIYREIIWRYHRDFPNNEFSKRRFLYLFIRIMVTYILTKVLLNGILILVLPQSILKIIDGGSLAAELLIFTTIFMIFFLYEGLYYMNISKTAEVRTKSLEKMATENQLSLLTTQVNPHFLFNSLNTLITIIPEDSDLAVNFVQQLSKTYRNILEIRDEKLITVDRELNALQSYIFLLQQRFHDKISINIMLSKEERHHFIIPLSLQLLIENAIKHNITSTKNPLHINIFSQEGFLFVRNNLQPKDQQLSSTKMGLNNISERYSILIDKSIEVMKDDHFFTVKLPLITNVTT